MEGPQDPESSVAGMRERAEELREVEKDEEEGGHNAVKIKDDGEKRLKKAQEKQEVVLNHQLKEVADSSGVHLHGSSAVGTRLDDYANNDGWELLGGGNDTNAPSEGMSFAPWRGRHARVCRTKRETGD